MNRYKGSETGNPSTKRTEIFRFFGQSRKPGNQILVPFFSVDTLGILF